MAPPDPALATRLAEVDERIRAAAGEAGRDPGEITRIVVTKFHPPSLVRALHALGVRDVGENRQQEFSAKIAELTDLSPALNWHFVGQLQSKKARAIRDGAALVHSVDRARLVDALERAADDGAPPLDVLMQLNLTDDLGRGGVPVEKLEPLAERIAGAATLRLRGVMAVAPLGQTAAAAFERLNCAAHRVRAIVPEAAWISAGMTEDFEEAIRAGATHLRIGSAITGPRPARV